MADMEFSAIYYPFYGQLNAQDQNLYKQILSAIRSGRIEMEVIGDHMVSGITKITSAIYYDRPELFWWGGEYSYSYQNDKLDTVKMKYNIYFEERDKKIAEFINAVNAFLVGLEGKSILEKERIIHDRIANKCTYEHSEGDQSAYALLVEKKAVCAGYSRGFQLLMQCIGVPTYYCRGISKHEKEDDGNHSWNMLKLGSDYYYLDMTWDDVYNTEPNDKRISYEYYNCSGVNFEKRHLLDEECLFLPACKGTKYSFENVFGHSAELEEIYQKYNLIDRCPLKDKSDYINRVRKAVGGQHGKVLELSFATQNKSLCGKGTIFAAEALKKAGYKSNAYKISGTYTDMNNTWFVLQERIEFL